jgi:hypothetical protein
MQRVLVWNGRATEPGPSEREGHLDARRAAPDAGSASDESTRVQQHLRCTRTEAPHTTRCTSARDGG